MVEPLDHSAVTRDAGGQGAGDTQSRIIAIEVGCSDPGGHCRRVETRGVDVAGLLLPTWEAVRQHEYETWDRPRLVLDTAGRSIDEAYSELRSRLDAPPSDR